MTQFRIYNYIDEERKFYGFTGLEIGASVAFIFGGFVFNAMIIAAGGCFLSVFVIRHVRALLKVSSLTRRFFFVFGDFLALKSGINIYAKYYL